MSVDQAEPAVGGTESDSPASAKLYVIPGSHACRTGMLLLEHKGIAYKTIELPTGAHPMMLKLLGFAGNREPIRTVDGRTHPSLAIIDRLGTVPALRYGGQRIQTNSEIIRFLERIRPEPPLYPADQDLRRAVEDAQQWGDETFQMAARRITLAAGLHGPSALYAGGARGRLGALLAHWAPVRRVSNIVAGRLAFKAGGANEAAQLAALPALLDRIDGWIAAGVLNGAELNAADFVIAPSLALLSYRLDLRGDLEARPCFALLERVLPEPEPEPEPLAA